MTFEEIGKDNKEICRELFRLINYVGNDLILAKEFTEFLKNEHRTLQANFIRMIQYILNEYARNEYTDLRNEAAVAFSKKVAEATADIGIPFI